MAEEVSQRCGILRAPPFSYGVAVGGGPYSGSTGLRRKTLHRAVNELFADWEDRGVQEFVILTAHRHEAHLEPLLMALTRAASKSVYDLYEIDTGDILEGDPETEHGGELETSLMLHLTPGLVRTDEIEDSAPNGGALRRYIRRRVPKGPASGSGVVGWPSKATAEKGRAVYDRYVDTLSAVLRDGPPTEP